MLLLLVAGACGGQAPGDAELRRTIDELLPRLEALSGLEAREPVRFARRDRAALRDYVAGQMERELPPGEIEGIAASYAALGLLPDTFDLRSTLLDLYTEQVVGYYDPATRRLYLLDDVPVETLRPVLAHELVHALQDQHADLDSLIARERGNDRQTAAQAAVEGHAMLVMLALAEEERSGGPVDPAALPDMRTRLRAALEAENERFPVFRDAPRILRETLLFPYLGGAAFVQALWASRAGAWAAPLDSLLPVSTEQVLHPEEAFLRRRDPPLELELEPGREWDVVYENTLGELETSILLEEHLGEGSAAAARGWEGDRFRLLRGPAGRALVWYSVWEDAAAADAFADAYRRVLDRRPARRGRVERLELEGRAAVLVVDAEAGVAPDRVPVPAVAAVQEVQR